jgi:hypothetical protein
MGYVVKVKRGKTTVYGKREYKTLAGANKSIKSPAGQAFIKQQKLKNVQAVKSRKKKKMKI